MEQSFLFNLMGRILVAALCGLIVGYERENRLKEAGIKTHMIVSVAACLMMMISKYGFMDMDSVQDPSRIAAQIVSGVGFLGAGIIFVRNQSVSGLTTAAGLWSTAGIGMAIGTGMIAMGIFVTILVLSIHFFARWVNRFSRKEHEEHHLFLEIARDPDVIYNLLEHFPDLTTLSFSAISKGNDIYTIDSRCFFESKKAKEQIVSELLSLDLIEKFSISRN